jgi:hypothetical protein
VAALPAVPPELLTPPLLEPAALEPPLPVDVPSSPQAVASSAPLSTPSPIKNDPALLAARFIDIDSISAACAGLSS